jgi:hypothetical protein
VMDSNINLALLLLLLNLKLLKKTSFSKGDGGWGGGGGSRTVVKSCNINFVRPALFFILYYGAVYVNRLYNSYEHIITQQINTRHVGTCPSQAVCSLNSRNRSPPCVATVHVAKQPIDP